MHGLTLRHLLGDNFLSRCPQGTTFDLVNGVIEIPRHDYTPARFVRSQHSRLWHSVEGNASLPMMNH